MDVTTPEPLPADHPLWGMPNVVITPHVASRAALTGARRRALLFENVRRFGAGQPLLNVVDKAAGEKANEQPVVKRAVVKRKRRMV